MTSPTTRKSLWEAVIEVVAHSPTPPHRAPLAQRLEQVMRHHVETEEESLEAYQRLGEESGDPVVRMLMQEVLVDEAHHHRLLERLEVQFERELDPATPGEGLALGPSAEGASAVELAASARALAAQERKGVRRLRKLARDHKDVYSGLFSLLLEGIAMDSEKHERVLRFVAQRLKEPESVGLAGRISKERCVADVAPHKVSAHDHPIRASVLNESAEFTD